MTYTIKIKFDNDDEECFEYPSPDGSVERLIPSIEGPNLLMGEISGHFAGDLCPAKLDVGDLIFCNYKNIMSKTNFPNSSDKYILYIIYLLRSNILDNLFRGGFPLFLHYLIEIAQKKVS